MAADWIEQLRRDKRRRDAIYLGLKWFWIGVATWWGVVAVIWAAWFTFTRCMPWN